MAYAVVWSEDGGPDFAGKLELEDESVVLSGTAPAALESLRRVPLSELADAHLGRLSRRRGGADTGLVLVRRDGGRVEIVSLEGAGALHELLERLALARGNAAP